jgi:NADH-quinone oxidoreductase subunit N/multicomponent Na+:H+ antiporter subunit D
MPPAVATWLMLGFFAAFAVKLPVVPLHTWLPDAYCHAPAPVTAVMAGVTKAGVLVALFLCFSALPAGSGAGAPATVLGTVVCALAVLTMTAGNLLALGQKDVRRVLAYSSVAQMGYVLLGFGIGLRWGVVSAFEAGLFYAVAYSVMKAGAFLGADLLAVSAGSSEISGLRGAGGRHPLLGLSFAVFVLGLVGLPATAGFPGKLLLVRSGFGTGEAAGAALALLLVLNSAISLGYYGPLLTGVLFRRREDPAPADGPAPPPAAMTSVACLALATILLGLFPSALGDWIQIASRTLFPGGAP